VVGVIEFKNRPDICVPIVISMAHSLPNRYLVCGVRRWARTGDTSRAAADHSATEQKNATTGTELGIQVARRWIAPTDICPMNQALKQLFRRSPFRDVFMGQQTVIPITGDIEVAVTGPEFPDIRFPVDARADYITILIPIAGRQPAGTGHITVSFPVQQ
jgi:hypothetical protein